MSKVLGEPRLGNKTEVSALTTETAILDWNKIKGKLEMRKTAWNGLRTWR